MPKRQRPKHLRPKPVIDLSEDLQAAIVLHHRGKLAQAERAYQKIIARDPQHAVAHHLLGRIFFQTNRQSAAVELLKVASAARRDYPEALLDLANMLSELGQLQKAEEYLQTLVAQRPGDATALNNLGVVLSDQGRYAAAIEAYQRALELQPSNADTLCNLASVYSLQEDVQQALDNYRRAIMVDGSHLRAHKCLASLLRRLNRHSEARDILAAWLKLEPDNPVPQHLLSAYDNEATPQRASDAYVRQVFDDFAKTFDSDLTRLGYRGPELIQNALNREYADSRSVGLVLDGGCGTGLCGPALRPVSQRLIGVDLSGKMLQVAARRNLYDELVEAELGTYLSDHPGQFDLFVCADTFGYFGELSELFSVAHGSLRAGGKLLVTVELGEIDYEPGFYLQASGRYSHNRDYVIHCCVKAGFTVRDRFEEIIRHEAGQSVRAMILTAYV